MSADQQFILAILAIVANLIGLVVTYGKTQQTHDLVNGMTRSNTRRSRRAAVVQERASVASQEATRVGMASRMAQNRAKTGVQPTKPAE